MRSRRCTSAPFTSDRVRMDEHDRPPAEQGKSNVSLVHIGPLELVGLEVRARRQELSDRVPRAWRQLVSHLDGIPHRVDDHTFYGVFPESQHREGATGVYSYWVAVPVVGHATVPPAMTTIGIPARDYACATVRGGAERIDPTYVAIKRWISERHREIDEQALALERYDSRRQSVLPPYDQFDYDVLRPLR